MLSESSSSTLYLVRDMVRAMVRDMMKVRLRVRASVSSSTFYLMLRSRAV